MLRPFADWLANTEISRVMQEQLWLVPTSQSIHILAVAAVFAPACMINLRLLGIGGNGRSIAQLSNSLIPWMWRGLAVLLFTGVIQIATEPVRQFVTPAFWAKMIMIIIVVAMTVTFARSVRRHAQAWDTASSGPAAAKAFAVASTVLWLAIIACGRFIGYTWTFYT